MFERVGSLDELRAVVEEPGELMQRLADARAQQQSHSHAGAVGVWRVDSVDAIALASAVKIGDADGGTASTESTIGTEGISAGPGGLIVTANEGESSASLVAPLSL